MNQVRILLKRYSIKGIPVGVNIDKGGYLVVATADRFVSYFKLILEDGKLSPQKFSYHAIGEYRRREEVRDNGKTRMSDALFNAHRKAVRQYVDNLPRKWLERLFFLGNVNWVPDKMFEAEESGRIVLVYGPHILFFQRRDPKRAQKEKKDPTKHVYWTLDPTRSNISEPLKITEKDFEKIKHYPNAWAKFFVDKRPSQFTPS